jgi:hypothetical protein
MSPGGRDHHFHRERDHPHRFWPASDVEDIDGGYEAVLLRQVGDPPKVGSLNFLVKPKIL